MVKLAGPLLSVEARGSLGPRLTYSSRPSGQQVRYQKKQTDIETPARLVQRGYFQMSVGWWNELTPTEQTEWKEEGNNP